RLAVARLLVGKRRAGIAVGEGVAGDAVVAEGHRGCDRAVIDLIDAGGGDSQRPGGDVGGGGGGGVEGVVAGGGGGAGDAADANQLGGPHVLIAEVRTAVAVRELVPSHAIVRKTYRRGGRAVVSLVDPGGRDRQRPGSDVGGGCGGGVLEDVVARVGAI